ESLGASKASTIRRIVVPLMAGGILAGFVTSFITAAVELSATILLTTSESQAPMSYGIYLYMQSVAGRGPGAAMGVLAVVIVALGTYASHVIVERTSALTRTRQVDDEEPAALPEVKTHTPAPTAGQIAIKGTEVTS
ncbi:ABC transporter permease subunit, partial [Herbaspirillum sp. GCM10030257]|uniref:ABC transporter permease subunit n=1 Tax=Herbaspirillum sp. GCM10030257 TaxID=3273393 RepID=UPI0036082B63